MTRRSALPERKQARSAGKQQKATARVATTPTQVSSGIAEAGSASEEDFSAVEESMRAIGRIIADIGRQRESADAVANKTATLQTLTGSVTAQIMRTAPLLAIMVSAARGRGSEAAVHAMALGAVDVVLKPGHGGAARGVGPMQAERVAKVRAAATVRLRRARRLRENLRADRAMVERWRLELRDHARAGLGLTLIGGSIGGPRALEEILPAQPADDPQPVLIAQHMPRAFTASLAARLNAASAACSDPAGWSAGEAAGRGSTARDPWRCSRGG